MKKILGLSFFIIFILAEASLATDSPEELYRSGNSSYENGDYEKAVSFYEELINIDRVNPEVYYNLGNSYFKLKKIGKSILNYERALKMDPRDVDTQLNLKLSRAMVVDKIYISDRGFVLNILLFLYDKVTINELSLACSFIYLAIILILMLSIFFVAKRNFMFYTTSVFGAVFIVLFIFLFTKIRNENFTKIGIIVTEKADTRSGPKEDYLLQFTLHEGTKVGIVKEAQGWYEIELSKDLKGWVPKTSVDII